MQEALGLSLRVVGPREARRIINGVERAALIACKATTLQGILRAAIVR
jgi:hypothetical protein